MKTVHAIYENGVFRPTDRVDLPERSNVEFEPRIVSNGERVPVLSEAERQASLERVYAILSERCSSGESDVAARHNEHQP